MNVHDFHYEMKMTMGSCDSQGFVTCGGGKKKRDKKQGKMFLPYSIDLTMTPDSSHFS